jgi:hypothetical protein
LRGLEADVSQKAIERISLANAVKPELGYRTATQLVSSGATVEEATGAALDAMQDVSMASNMATGASPEEITNAVVAYLTSQGLDPTGVNIRKIGGGVQQVFRGGNLQLSDLTELAQVGSGLRTLRPDEQIAAMAALKDLGNTGSTAATGLEGLVTRLETAKASNAKVAALQKIGLTPEDVDFVGEGEDLNVVLGRLQKGLNSVPEEDRKALMKTLVEEAGVKTLSGLMASREKIDRYVGAQGNLAAFEADVVEAQSGIGAARTRNEGARELRMAQLGQDIEGRGLAMEESLVARGATPLQADLQRLGFDAGAYMTGTVAGGRLAAGAVGMLPQINSSAVPELLPWLGLAATGGPGGMVGMAGAAATQARSVGQGLTEADRMYLESQRAHTEALNRNTEATERNTNANGSNSSTPPASSPPRPAAPRPSQARSR